MAEKLKSNSDVADRFASAIEMQGDFIVISGEGKGLTNLTAMGKLQSTIEHMNLSNSAYANLLSKDAVAISRVREEYQKLDEQISRCMGIE